MPNDLISTCPVCANELAVTRLHCRACGTTLEGDFSAGRFSRLSREQLAVLESFLRSRGNLREMERELGISYPTVRSRVEAVVSALGFGPRADADETVGAAEPGGGAAEPGEAGTEAGTELGDVATEPGGAASSRHEILERLARHEITAEEAATAIRSPGRTDR